MKKTDFPFKANDVLNFPDTDTEYVDVGIGEIPVAKQQFYNCLRVIKIGKGLSLKFIDNPKDIYSEAFDKWERKGKDKNIISLKQYIDYFGDFKELTFVCKWEDFDFKP